MSKETTTVEQSVPRCSTPIKSDQNNHKNSATKRSASKLSLKDSSAKKVAVEEWSCPICLASKTECTESNGGVYALICGHTFCTECVEEWLQQHDSCPVCKTRQQQHHRRAPSGVFAGAGNQNPLTRFFLPPATPTLFAAITAALDQNSNSRSSSRSSSGSSSNGGSNANSDDDNPFSALLLNDIEALRRRVAMIRQETERREQQRREQFEQRVQGGNVRQQQQQHRYRNASTQEAVDDARFAAHMRLAIQQSLEDAERLQRAARTVVAENAAPNINIAGEQAATSTALQTLVHPPPLRAISTNAADRRLIVHGTCQGQISADGRSVQCKVEGCRGVVLRANFARHCERMHGLEECPRCHNQIQHHMMKRHRMRECRNNEI